MAAVGISAGDWSAMHLNRNKRKETESPKRSKIVSTHSMRSSPFEDESHLGKSVTDESEQMVLFVPGSCKC
jgi:hypothetical protein